MCTFIEYPGYNTPSPNISSCQLVQIGTRSIKSLHCISALVDERYVMSIVVQTLWLLKVATCVVFGSCWCVAVEQPE